MPKVVAFTAGRRNGTTETLTKIALEQIANMGIEVELIRLNECDLHPCSACGNGPYDEYSRAYEMLRQESSFATSTRQFYHSIDPATGAMDTYEASADSQVVKTDGGYDGISYTQFYGEEDSYSAEVYIRDGRSYSVVY